jgi:Na+-driven multidrug efflux pump
LALYFGLIPTYGQAGAGMATTLSYLITSLIFIIWFGKEYKGWYYMMIPQKKDISDFRGEMKKMFAGKD